MCCSLFSILGLVVGSAVFIKGSIYTFEQPILPGYPDQCYSKDKQNFYNVGQEFQDKDLDSCSLVHCDSVDSDGEMMSLSVETCGAVDAGPGCEVVTGDLSQTYPDCCDTFQCA